MTMRNMMMFVLMFICCMVVGKCKGGGYDPPPNCAVVDCPIYSVIQSEKEFEIRNYSEAIWMSTPTFPQFSIVGALGEGGRNLSDYFFKENDKGVVIEERGRPVGRLDILSNSSYILYFYFPYKYQNGSAIIPKPLVPQLKQVKLPKYKFAAVRRSLGECNDDQIVEELDKLKRNLQGTPYQRAIDSDQFSYVLYSTFEFTSGCEILLSFD